LDSRPCVGQWPRFHDLACSSCDVRVKRNIQKLNLRCNVRSDKEHLLISIAWLVWACAGWDTTSHCSISLYMATGGGARRNCFCRGGPRGRSVDHNDA
jgi:hypothetical protein